MSRAGEDGLGVRLGDVVGEILLVAGLTQDRAVTLLLEAQRQVAAAGLEDPAAVQGYVTACYRAQRWIQKAPEAEILELLYKPYMDTFSRDEVLKSIRYYRGIFDWDFLVDEKPYREALKIFLATKVLEQEVPFARAVDMSFVRKAAQKSS